MSDQQPALNRDSGQIPYHQVYFGCCNRAVMTREDVAQPMFCPFCGKSLLNAAPRPETAGPLAQPEKLACGHAGRFRYNAPPYSAGDKAENWRCALCDATARLDEGAPTSAAHRIWNDLAEFLAFLGPVENKAKAIAAIQGRIVEMLNSEGVTQAALAAPREGQAFDARKRANEILGAYMLDTWIFDEESIAGELQRAYAAGLAASTGEGGAQQPTDRESIIKKLDAQWCGEVSSTRKHAWGEAIDAVFAAGFTPAQLSAEQTQVLREQIEEALWLQAEGKDYYKAPLSVRREILDIAMPILVNAAQSFVPKSKTEEK